MLKIKIGDLQPGESVEIPLFTGDGIAQLIPGPVEDFWTRAEPAGKAFCWVMIGLAIGYFLEGWAMLARALDAVLL